MALPQVLSPLFIRTGNFRGWFFAESLARSVCLPAALGSTGGYPASFRGDGCSVFGFPAACLGYYGGSDFCRARGLPRVLPRQISCVHIATLSRPTVTNHTAIPRGALRCRPPQVDALADIETSPFASRLVVLAVPNRVHFFYCGRSGSFPLLSTPPRGDAVTSSSQPGNGPNWPGSFTPEGCAASQRIAHAPRVPALAPSPKPSLTTSRLAARNPAAFRRGRRKRHARARALPDRDHLPPIRRHTRWVASQDIPCVLGWPWSSSLCDAPPFRQRHFCAYARTDPVGPLTRTSRSRMTRTTRERCRAGIVIGVDDANLGRRQATAFDSFLEEIMGAGLTEDFERVGRLGCSRRRWLSHERRGCRPFGGRVSKKRGALDSHAQGAAALLAHALRELALIHAAYSASLISPAASASVRKVASTSSAWKRRPFNSRKSTAVTNAIRLFPSMNG